MRHTILLVRGRRRAQMTNPASENRTRYDGTRAPVPMASTAKKRVFVK